MEKRIYDHCPCAESGIDGNRSCIGAATLIENDNAVIPACANHLPSYLRNAGWKIQSNWKEDIYQALIRVAKREPEFTNDDVFEEFDKIQTTVNPDRRSYGNVVQKALKEGVMEWTGSSIVSRRKNCHKMLIRVYKSNIYKYTPMSWFRVLWNHIKLWGV
jgi:hypothetical protein